MAVHFALAVGALAITQGSSATSYIPADSQKRVESAISSINKRLGGLSDEDFNPVATERRKTFSGLQTSTNTSQLELLRTDLREAFAQLQLVQSFPDGSTDETVIQQLILGSGGDFFGSNGHYRVEDFQVRSRLLERLANDAELRLADRLFLSLKGANQSHAASLQRWTALAQELAGPQYLGQTERMSLSRQAQCVQGLYLLSVVSKSHLVDAIAAESVAILEEFEEVIDSQLLPAAKAYCRGRFERDGALRDRSLPVFGAAKFLSSELSYESVGITTQANYLKYALAHARGLATLARKVDEPEVDIEATRKAIGQIIDYRIQPFYIGSEEVREKGTYPCAPEMELEVLLERAAFFDADGHVHQDTYRKCVAKLERQFLSPSAKECRDYFFAMKSPQQWLSYFGQVLVGPGQSSCIKELEAGEVTPRNLKDLFLARCILTHSAYDTTLALSDARDALISRLVKAAPQLAVNHFKERPNQWNQVDLAFVEISKLEPSFDLESLSIPTYKEYKNQRKDYDRAVRSIPGDFIELSDPDTNMLLDNELGLFQSDYVYRTGKFNKKLSPVFIRQINEKLDAIMSYRNSQFTPPDTKERPGMSKMGTPIRELAVSNRHYPQLEPANPQLHDLLEGAGGGFGGMGRLFLSDPKGYEQRESALDAIASSDELQLAETLFRLAMDVGVREPTMEDKAMAARRWLNYFKKTQSLARYQSTNKELTNAIRGAFVCRLVVQCDEFIEAVEHSPQVAIGSSEDVSTVLETTLASQVRTMSSILSAVDPSSALNKDIDQIKERWFLMKAWHTESMKWLESVMADPLLMSEVSRIRSLARDRNASYDDVVPAISKLESTLRTVEPRILSERHSDNLSEDSFRPLEFANLIMGELVAIQSADARSTTTIQPEGGVSDEQEDFESMARDISDQLYKDIREAVSVAGFGDLSHVNSVTDVQKTTASYYEQVGYTDRSKDGVKHDLLLTQLKGAVAKAKGRIEAERVTDLKALEDLSLRASKADRIFFAGDPNRYSLLIDPSFILYEWNNRHKIETMAEFRTIETRAQAQTQIFRFRKEREKLERERGELSDQRDELDMRLAQARKWAEDNGAEFNPEAVIDEMIVMEDKIAALQDEIAGYEGIEEKYRQQHIVLAEQLHSLKVGQRFDRIKTTEMLLAKAEIAEPTPAATTSQSTSEPATPITQPYNTAYASAAPKKKPTNYAQTNYQKKTYSSSSKKTYSKPTYKKTYTPKKRTTPSSSRSSGNFFQRLFRR